MKTLKSKGLKALLIILMLHPLRAISQTDQDALMMEPKKICVAALYSTNSWVNYWEGNFKRDNANIGRLSSQTAMIMFSYGLNKSINILASVPYIATKASSGTLSGLSGVQDVSMFVKWKPLTKALGKQKFSLFAVGGFSTPSNDYNIDFTPVAIGNGSKVLSIRSIFDIERNKLFATISGAFMYRSNVFIDRSAYYTTQQINSNEVQLPNVGNIQVRSGYRSKRLYAELFFDRSATFGGFDIRKNDMPFVSNKMNRTVTGLELKYYPSKIPSLGFIANSWHTLAGRNVGQSTGYTAGMSYAFNVQKNKEIRKSKS
jgi:hypothetical protein